MSSWWCSAESLCVRAEWESDEQWTMRKRFIMQCNSSVADKKRLISLSHCFINMEFMGCSYNKEIDREIRDLARGLHRSSECNIASNNHVAFSSRSTAGNQKSKSPLLNASTSTNNHDSRNQSCAKAGASFACQAPPVPERIQAPSAPKRVQSKTKAASKVSADETHLKAFATQLAASTSSAEAIVQRVNVAASKSKVPIEILIADVREEPTKPAFSCKLSIACVQCGCAVECSKKLARQQACIDVVQRVSRPYYKIIFSSDGAKELISSNDPIENDLECDEEMPEALVDSNAECLLDEKDKAHPKIQQVMPTKKLKTNGSGDQPVGHAATPLSFSDDDFVVLRRFEELGPTNARSALNTTAQFNKTYLDYVTSELPWTSKHRCDVFLESKFLASGEGTSINEAKDNAALNALKTLATNCYSVVVKSSIDREASEITITQVAGDLQKLSHSLPESNIGNKLLRKMGWTGGGIGKEGQGIAEPVTVKDVFKRQGIGLNSESGVSPRFKTAMRCILQEYLNSNNQSDLVFSADFSKEQRAFIHMISHRMNLKSVSYGANEERQLTITRHRSKRQLVQLLISQGGENSKYKIIPPGHDD